MTSLTTSMNSTLSGMRIAQSQLAIISNNISNAGDENYTRKTLDTQSITLGGNGSGGVMIKGYSRAIDNSLMASYNTPISAASLTTTQDYYYQSVKDLYGLSNDSTQLSTTMSSFTNAWQTYQSNP